MDSVFEKITLYDILGYLIPGLLFEILVAAEIILNQILTGQLNLDKVIKMVSDANGILILCMIVSAYCIGITVSEIASLFERKIELYIKKDITYYYEKLNKFSPLNDATLKKALRKTKMVDKNDLNNLSVSELQQKYEALMYTLIQSNEQYKRIHNYTSAKLLYRNLVAVLVFTMLCGMVLLKKAFQQGICIFFIKTSALWLIWILVIIMLANRYRRFWWKIKCYTRVWFTQLND